MIFIIYIFFIPLLWYASRIEINPSVRELYCPKRTNINVKITTLLFAEKVKNYVVLFLKYLYIIFLHLDKIKFFWYLLCSMNKTDILANTSIIIFLDVFGKLALLVLLVLVRTYLIGLIRYINKKKTWRSGTECDCENDYLWVRPHSRR